MRRIIKSLDLGKPELLSPKASDDKTTKKRPKFIAFFNERDSMNKLILDDKGPHRHRKREEYNIVERKSRRLLSNLFKDVQVPTSPPILSLESEPMLTQEKGWIAKNNIKQNKEDLRSLATLSLRSSRSPHKITKAAVDEALSYRKTAYSKLNWPRSLNESSKSPVMQSQRVEPVQAVNSEPVLITEIGYTMPTIAQSCQTIPATTRDHYRSLPKIGKPQSMNSILTSRFTPRFTPSITPRSITHEDLETDKIYFPPKLFAPKDPKDSAQMIVQKKVYFKTLTTQGSMKSHQEEQWEFQRKIIQMKDRINTLRTNIGENFARSAANCF